MRLSRKVALVTGAAMGIGAGVARRFVAQGAQVALCDINIDHVTEMARSLGDAARAFPLDVSDREAWTRVAEAVEAAFGSVHILVNNAGVGAQTYVETLRIEELQRVLSINLNGVLFGMQAALPSLRRSGAGVILNVSSLQGLEADVGLTAYVASKFAVRGITKSAALEFGREGVRVNSIHPGMIRTPQMFGDALPDTYFGQVPLHRRDAKDRAGYPDDVGDLAVFLASDEAGYITGAEFVIDGGKSVRLGAFAPEGLFA